MPNIPDIPLHPGAFLSVLYLDGSEEDVFCLLIGQVEGQASPDWWHMRLQ